MAFFHGFEANLFKIPINGSNRVVVRPRIRCTSSLTIEFKTNTVYWNDYCSHVVETVKIDGTQYTIVYSGHRLMADGISNGIAHYEHMLYWVQSTRLYTVDLTSEDDHGRSIYRTGHLLLAGMQVVHPSKQPGTYVFD